MMMIMMMMMLAIFVIIDYLCHRHQAAY